MMFITNKYCRMPNHEEIIKEKISYVMRLAPAVEFIETKLYLTQWETLFIIYNYVIFDEDSMNLFFYANDMYRIIKW